MSQKAGQMRSTNKPKVPSTGIKAEDEEPIELYTQRLSPSLRNSDLELSLCYTRKHLYSGGLIDLALQGAQLNDIITGGTTTANGQIFHQALLSLATTLFGTQHRQHDITKMGHIRHGVALNQLNVALSSSYSCTSEHPIS
ncbi:hypothetical protein D0Z07_7367 [Hyphodiscus hymeniophilus]|uniref:Uncharacterized protein n=1 Tax=Hyphodiscus hymeniophilus TaxID=353542 RepID=A0A9P6VEK2_9HELO|nr:hypothetical protein D0Z07_7367 [Hyphodiscus hymeniophilus]